MNLRLAMEESVEREFSSVRHARVMSHVATALADAAIAAWDTKFTYWGDRPVIGIRRLYDPTWTSFIGTPPFPGYISGHSTFSGAASEVLAYFFPDEAITFRAFATEAAMSRYYGGIHVRSDNEIGLDVGAKIANLAIARAMVDGVESG
jgi:membrane-associated phospholipid phosphatase